MNFFRVIVAAGLVATSAAAFSVPAKAADVTGAGAPSRFRSIPNGLMPTRKRPATV